MNKKLLVGIVASFILALSLIVTLSLIAYIRNLDSTFYFPVVSHIREYYRIKLLDDREFYDLDSVRLVKYYGEIAPLIPRFEDKSRSIDSLLDYYGLRRYAFMFHKPTAQACIGTLFEFSPSHKPNYSDFLARILGPRLFTYPAQRDSLLVHNNGRIQIYDIPEKSNPKYILKWEFFNDSVRYRVYKRLK
jgi:hypothetical protein